MKKFIFFARVYTWWTIVLPFSISAQDTATVYPNYVVIGAFAIHDNAVEFSDEANKSNFPAKFEMNLHRNLYYVYVLTTHDRALAFAEAVKLRTDSKYFDTWVYSGTLGKHELALRGGGGDLDYDPETGDRLNSVRSEKSLLQPANGDASTRSANGERRVAISNSGSSDPSQKTPESGAGEAVSKGKNSRRNKKDDQSVATGDLGERSNQQANGQNGAQQLTPELQPSDEASRNGAGQTSRQGVKTDATTKGVAATQNASRTTGAAGQNNKQGAAQQGNAKSGQNAGQESRQGVKTDATTKGVASTQNASQTTGAAGQNNKQGTIPRGNAKPGLSAGQPDPEAGKELSTTGTLRGTGLNSGAEGVSADSLTAASLSRETDKALTDAGRKALTENRQRQAALGPPPVKVTTVPLTKDEIAGKDFYFYLFRGDNLDVVDGEVDAIDVEKSRRMATYQGNTPVKVMMPSGKDKQMSFVCQVFGYRKQQKEFDPSAPPEDLYLDNKGNLVVPFELARMQKGDIAIMYNVFFFKDAAVMRPESRYEVNNLLELLAENPTYKIMIHGHTNGNAAGKIIRMDTPENFYSLSGTKQGFGSAKELSEERAMVIRDFLVNSGISIDRMQVRAWGGKKPIHDKHSARANENVRVEVEILSE